MGSSPPWIASELLGRFFCDLEFPAPCQTFKVGRPEMNLAVSLCVLLPCTCRLDRLLLDRAQDVGLFPAARVCSGRRLPSSTIGRAMSCRSPTSSSPKQGQRVGLSSLSPRGNQAVAGLCRAAKFSIVSQNSNGIGPCAKQSKVLLARLIKLGANIVIDGGSIDGLST